MGGMGLPCRSAGLPCGQAGVRAQSCTDRNIWVWLNVRNCELLEATGFY